MIRRLFTAAHVASVLAVALMGCIGWWWVTDDPHAAYEYFPDPTNTHSLSIENGHAALMKGRVRILSVSLSAVFLAIAFVPIASFLSWIGVTHWQRRRDSKVSTAICPACRYDLRGSIDRCPECGTPISKEVKA